MKKKKKVVVDSSVIVKWVNSQDEKDLKKADKLLSDCQKNKIIVYAPELAKYEIVNALLYKKMEMPMTKASLDGLKILPLIYARQTLDELKKAIEIAKKENITLYDAVFIHLAIKEKAILVTANPKHQKIKTGKIRIISLSDY